MQSPIPSSAKLTFTEFHSFHIHTYVFFSSTAVGSLRICTAILAPAFGVYKGEISFLIFGARAKREKGDNEIETGRFTNFASAV